MRGVAREKLGESGIAAPPSPTDIDQSLRRLRCRRSFKVEAEQTGVRMPSFFGYVFRYSIPVLVPVFILVTLLIIWL